MRYVKALGLMLLAVLALSAVMVSGASAAEGEVLTTGAFPETSTTADTATATFEATGSAIIVKCPTSAGSLTQESSTKGKFTENFKGCTAAGAKCTGLGNSTAGEITVKGSTELLAFKNGEVLDLAVVFTPEAVHFECLGILTEVKGSVIGLVTTAAGTKTASVSSSLTGSKGKESITSVNGVEHVLLSETNGGAFVEGSQNQQVTATGSNLVELMY